MEITGRAFTTKDCRCSSTQEELENQMLKNRTTKNIGNREYRTTTQIRMQTSTAIQNTDTGKAYCN